MKLYSIVFFLTVYAQVSCSTNQHKIVQTFATADPSMKWDGTFAGNKQATQVYIWQVSAISAGGQKIQKKGTFVLIR